MGSEREAPPGSAHRIGRWWRRVRRATNEPDPTEVVRRIVEAEEGAERAVVEILAEQEGIPWSVARATIDRLCADGRLAAYRGPDGAVRLARPSFGGRR